MHCINVALDTDSRHEDCEVDDEDEELPHVGRGGEMRPVARHHRHQASTWAQLWSWAAKYQVLSL